MTEPEYHVASYVVNTLPEASAEVSADIESIPGLEVHAAENGKLVITAEAGGARELADITTRLGTVKSVLTVSPVYHEFTTELISEDGPEAPLLPTNNTLDERENEP